MRQIVISKQTFIKQYETMPTKEICKYYGICSARFYKILDDFGIERKIKRSKNRDQVSIRYGE